MFAPHTYTCILPLPALALPRFQRKCANHTCQRAKSDRLCLRSTREGQLPEAAPSGAAHGPLRPRCCRRLTPLGLSAMLSRALNLPLRRERGRCVGQARQEPACNGRRCRRARRGNQAGAARAVWRRMCGEPGAERPFLSKGSPADRSRHSLLANCSHAHSS